MRRMVDPRCRLFGTSHRKRRTTPLEIRARTGDSSCRIRHLLWSRDCMPRRRRRADHEQRLESRKRRYEQEDGPQKRRDVTCLAILRVG